MDSKERIEAGEVGSLEDILDPRDPLIQDAGPFADFDLDGDPVFRPNATAEDKKASPPSTDPNSAIADAAAEEMKAGPNGTEAEAAELSSFSIFTGRSATHREATVFDIETGALPDDELAELMPEFGEFHELEVKLGNLKDEAKIKAKIKAAREQHEVDRKKAKANFIDKAALSATTGHVVAIGYLRGDGQTVLDLGHDNPEGSILIAFWRHYLYCREKKTHLIGFNSNGFDLPFLIRRSWKYGIEVPQMVLAGRYFDKVFFDLMLHWGCGKFNDFVSLDTVARFLDVGQKPSDCTGADFAKLLASSNPADRKKALDYLHGDLKMTWGVAAAMGVVLPLTPPVAPKQQPKGDQDDSRKA
ncbi:hypothetical protein LCGC14_2180860 [marine sediment metagenome]|uniref:YprB ribonuclease H-like domain-containing protein n=1 Tax=marine sediment metagenome TaxID=412755 RepID=A0A0F9DMG7_9ZZZZ